MNRGLIFSCLYLNIRSLGLTLLLAGLLLIMSGAAGSFAQGRRQQRKPARNPRPTFTACLPSDVKESEIAVYGLNRAKNVTVGNQLRKLKARCRKNRLVGPDKREIRFFRLVCWGNPPPDYQEIQAEQNRKLEELKAKYTVVVIGCDPHTP